MPALEDTSGLVEAALASPWEVAGLVHSRVDFPINRAYRELDVADAVAADFVLPGHRPVVVLDLVLKLVAWVELALGGSRRVLLLLPAVRAQELHQLFADRLDFVVVGGRVIAVRLLVGAE